MNGAQSGWRLRVAVILALMIALALGSFWLRDVMRRAASDHLPDIKRSEPDFYVDNFNFVKFSKDGQAQYHFSGSRLTHNPLDDSYDAQQPVVHSIGKGGAPMTVRAQRGHMNSDSSRVQLYQDVHMDRPAAPGSDDLHVQSDYMLLLPDDDVARTDGAVKIVSGTKTLTGVGMYANNATREFRLASNVHGTYQPPSR